MSELRPPVKRVMLAVRDVLLAHLVAASPQHLLAGVGPGIRFTRLQAPSETQEEGLRDLVRQAVELVRAGPSSETRESLRRT